MAVSSWSKGGNLSITFGSNRKVENGFSIKDAVEPKSSVDDLSCSMLANSMSSAEFRRFGKFDGFSEGFWDCLADLGLGGGGDFGGAGDLDFDLLLSISKLDLYSSLYSVSWLTFGWNRDFECKQT